MRSRRWRATAGLCLGRGARTRALLLDAIRAGQVVLEDVRAARLAGLRTVARERSEAQGVARVWQREWSSALYPSCCARGVPLCKMAPPPDLPQSWERAHHIIVVRHLPQRLHNCKAKLFNQLSAAKLRRRALRVRREQKTLTKMATRMTL